MTLYYDDKRLCYILIEVKNHVHLSMSSDYPRVWGSFVHDNEFVRYNLPAIAKMSDTMALRTYLAHYIPHFNRANLCLRRVKRVRTCRP